jgi:hypothetical protein
VTSQGSAYGRVRRALDTANPTIVLAAAAELDFVSLPGRARDRPPTGRRPATVPKGGATLARSLLRRSSGRGVRRKRRPRAVRPGQAADSTIRCLEQAGVIRPRDRVSASARLKLLEYVLGMRGYGAWANRELSPDVGGAQIRG